MGINKRDEGKKVNSNINVTPMVARPLNMAASCCVHQSFSPPSGPNLRPWSSKP
jgi:hypothetical protein